MRKRKAGLFVGVFVSVLAVATFLWAQSYYATKIYIKQGGAEQVIASGGKQTVESGGIVDLKSGAALNAAGTATIAGITHSNLVDKSTAIDFGGNLTLTTGKTFKATDSGSILANDKKVIVSFLPEAQAICAGTDSLVTGTKTITFVTAFKADTTPRIMLTNLTAANAMYASGVSNAGFTANGTTTDSFDFLAIGEAP